MISKLESTSLVSIMDVFCREIGVGWDVVDVYKADVLTHLWTIFLQMERCGVGSCRTANYYIIEPVHNFRCIVP